MPGDEAKSAKRTYPIRVLGRTLAIQSSADQQHVDAVAGLVSERMGEIRDRFRSADLVEVAILAALNFADDYLRTQDRLEDERQRVSNWAEDMCKRVGNHA